MDDVIEIELNAGDMFEYKNELFRYLGNIKDPKDLPISFCLSFFVFAVWVLCRGMQGFSSCSTQDFSHCGAQAPWLQLMGLVAMRHVGSSSTRDGTHVPCIGR